MWDRQHPLTIMSDGARYHITDMDTAGGTKYYGFTGKDAYWMILQENTVAGTYRYASGIGDYPTAWTGRAGLTYSYYYEVA